MAADTPLIRLMNVKGGKKKKKNIVYTFYAYTYVQQVAEETRVACMRLWCTQYGYIIGVQSVVTVTLIISVCNTRLV